MIIKKILLPNINNSIIKFTSFAKFNKNKLKAINGKYKKSKLQQCFSCARKCVIAVLLLLIITAAILPQDFAIASKDSMTEEDIEYELETNVEEQLENIDLSALEDLLIEYANSDDFFEGYSFKEKVLQILDGNLSLTFDTFASYLFAVLFDNFYALIPLLSGIIAIAVICSFTCQLSENSKTRSIQQIIYFACFGIVVAMVIGSVTSLVTDVKSVISSIQLQMEIIFPIILALITVTGSVTTSATMQPLVSLLAGGIVDFFSNFMIPLFLVSLVFAIIANISNTVKLDKFSKFFGSLFKWCIGGIFTIFMAFLAIKGLTASSIDGVSIQTAKFAIKSYIPLVGSYISEGFSLIIASSILIKNAIGVTSLILLAITVLNPILNLILLSLGLKLVASIIEPLTDNKMSNFVFSVANILQMLLVILIVVAFMYLICVGMLLMCGNVL